MASKTRILKEWQAMLYIFLVTFFNYGFIIALMVWQETHHKLDNEVTYCLNRSYEHRNQSFIFPIVTFGKIVLIAMIGLFCDLSLFHFVKKRKNAVHDANAVEMIPWKSLNKDVHDKDLHIPARASILSSLFVVATLIISIGVFTVIGSLQSTAFKQFVGSIIVLVPCGAPIVTILFTIKAHSEEKSMTKQAQPPAQLQFHEENDNQDESQV